MSPFLNLYDDYISIISINQHQEYENITLQFDNLYEFRKRKIHEKSLIE